MRSRLAASVTTHAGAGVAQPVLDALVAVEHRHRQQDRRVLVGAEEDRGGLGQRRQQRGHAVPALDAVGGEHVGEPVREVLQLAEARRAARCPRSPPRPSRACRAGACRTRRRRCCSARAPPSGAPRASPRSCRARTSGSSSLFESTAPRSVPSPPRSPRSTCRSATPPAPCRRCRPCRPRSGGPIRAAAARGGRAQADGQARRSRRRSRAADTGRSLATISVLVSSIGSRSTCGNTSPIVAVSTFSRSSWSSGWPAFTITTPPGASRSRTSSKNSSVAR